MVYDSEVSSSPRSSGFGLLDDVPPSYDSISTTTGGDYPEGSGSGAGAGSSSAGPPWPAAMNGLFNGPPHAEPMITRDRADSGPRIEVAKWNDSWDTCDRKLEDPEVLYNFLRAQALSPPTAKIRCRSSHYETATRTESVVEEGITRTVSSGQQYRVTDFDFTIDVTPVYGHEDNLSNVHLFVKPLTQPASRGGYISTSLVGGQGLQRVSWAQNTLWNKWTERSRVRGYAPWAEMESDAEFVNNNLTQGAVGSRLRAEDEEALLGDTSDYDNLKYWCERYCADPGLFKRFELEKVVWGWDFGALRQAIERAILTTGYQPTEKIQIDIKVDGRRVVVRHNNWLVRASYNPVLNFLLWITLLWPFIWLWQRCTRSGGGPYDVAVASYGMKFYPPLPSTYPNESIENARHRLPAMFKLHPEIPRNPFLHRGPKGIHYLLGRREGEWFREWEERIRMAVRCRFHGEVQNTRVVDDEEAPELDGY